MTPRATYRLQFSAAFRFADAQALAPYLAALGVSHVYASPVFAARVGSTHGYDTVDHGQLNPELGGEPAFRQMAATFRENGLGLILDFVPNHMGIGGADNTFWLSVLERGRDSPFVNWFDIDWVSDYPGLRGKVLVPVLGESYGTVLADGGFELRYDKGTEAFAVWAQGTHKLPVRPEDQVAILRGVEDSTPTEQAARLDAIAAVLQRYRGAPGDAKSWAQLDALMERQHWRAAKFDLDCDAINYRRFFVISDLAGLRVERPEVFETTHRLLRSLLGEGLIDGVRIDHIDGLADPKAYALRLRASAAKPFYLVVEKILAPDETLPEDWEIDGTTGYEFANLIVGLLVDPAGEEILSKTYADFTGDTRTPDAIVHTAKLEIMDRRMAAELEALTTRLHRIAVGDSRTRDLGRGALRMAVAQVVAALDVYRSYADASGTEPEDRQRIDRAVAAARMRAPALDPAVFDLVRAALTLELADARPCSRAHILDFVVRFQQLSGPVMAKGLEDTALYRYNRLIALNEVGSKPGMFSIGIERFHEANSARLANEPRAMLGTSTHDTKRGEDARARIAALSGHAPTWAENVEKWHDLLAGEGAPIGRDMEYFFLQLLVGVWPAKWRPGTDVTPDAARALVDRVAAAMIKSAREASVHTRWVYGDPEYEAGLTAFVARALNPAPGNAFLNAFRDFEAMLFEDGVRNALAQVVLKLTVPGVPDLYQGTELWDQSLVDPDNRRQVDFSVREQVLRRLRASGIPPAEASWEDGTVKLALTECLLGLRRRKPALFSEGGYEPLRVQGAGRALGFARRHDDDVLIIAVALQDRGSAIGRRGVTVIPPLGCDGPWEDLLGETSIAYLEGRELFSRVPVAVLLNAKCSQVAARCAKSTRP